jgi:hypothetical protein
MAGKRWREACIPAIPLIKFACFAPPFPRHVEPCPIKVNQGQSRSIKVNQGKKKCFLWLETPQSRCRIIHSADSTPVLHSAFGSSCGKKTTKF